MMSRGRALIRKAIALAGGTDIFISYRRHEASDYAQALFAALEEGRVPSGRRYRCFLDNHLLDAGMPIAACEHEAARSRMFVLVGSPTILESQHVPLEITAYSNARRGWIRRQWIRLVPINVEGALDSLEDRELATRTGVSVHWAPLVGKVAEPESLAALRAGRPSESVIHRIDQSFVAIRASVTVIGVAMAIAAGILVLSGVGLRLASRQRDALQKQVVAARESLAQTDAEKADVERQLKASTDRLATTNGELTAARQSVDDAMATAAAARADVAANRRRLQASNLAVWADSLVERDPTQSLAVAKEAYALEPTFTASRALIRAFNRSDVFYTHLYRAVSDADLSPNGQDLALVSGGKARIIRLDTSAEIPLSTDNDVKGIRFVQNGKTILTWSNGSVRQWDRQGRESGRPLDTGFSQFPLLIEPCGAGTIVLVVGSHDVYVWNLNNSSARKIAIESGRVIPVKAVRCSPTSREFVFLRWPDRPQLWTVDGESRLLPFQDVQSAEYSADGASLALAHANGVSVIRAGAGTSTVRPRADRVAFKRDTDQLVTGVVGTGQLCVGDHCTPSVPDEGSRRDVILSSDGERAVFTRADGAAVLTDVRRRREWLLRGHERSSDVLSGAITRTVWSKGSRLLTLGKDRTARVWDDATSRVRVWRNTPAQTYVEAKVSVDRTLVALTVKTTNGAGRAPEFVVELRNIQTDELITELHGHEEVPHVLFSRSNQLVTYSTKLLQITGPTQPVRIDVPEPEPGTITGATISLSPNHKDVWVNYSLSRLPKTQPAARGWTLDGMPLAAPRAADSPEPRAVTTSPGLRAEWLRIGDREGWVLIASDARERFWLDVELRDLKNLASDDELRSSGYLTTRSDEGIELSLVDPRHILEAIRRTPNRAAPWELDGAARRDFGLAGVDVQPRR